MDRLSTPNSHILGMEYGSGSHIRHKIGYSGELTRAMIDEYSAHRFERNPNDGFEVKR